MNITVYYNTSPETEFDRTFAESVIFKIGMGTLSSVIVSPKEITDEYLETLINQVRKSNISPNRQFALFLETAGIPARSGKRQMFISRIMEIADTLKALPLDFDGFDFKIIILGYSARYPLDDYLKLRYSNDRLEHTTWEHGNSKEVLEMMKPNIRVIESAATTPHPYSTWTTPDTGFTSLYSYDSPQNVVPMVNIFHCNMGSDLLVKLGGPQLIATQPHIDEINGMTSLEYVEALRSVGEHIFLLPQSFGSYTDFPDDPITWCTIPDFCVMPKGPETYADILTFVCERARPGKILNLILPIPRRIVLSNTYSDILRAVGDKFKVRLQLKQPLYNKRDVEGVLEIMRTELVQTPKPTPKPELKTMNQSTPTPTSNLEMLHELTVVSRLQNGKFSITSQHLEINPIMGWGDVISAQRKDQATLVSSRLVIGTLQSREVITTDVIIIPSDVGTFTEVSSGLLIGLNGSTWAVLPVSDGEEAQCCLIKLDNHLFESTPKFEMDTVSLVI